MKLRQPRARVGAEFGSSSPSFSSELSGEPSGLSAGKGPFMRVAVSTLLQLSVLQRQNNPLMSS